MKKSTNKSSRKWLWPTIISVSVVILGIATGVICWAIGKAQEDKESGVSKDKVVMIVTSRGGMCSDGPCDHKRYSLYEDGRFEDHENLTKTEVARIKSIVSKHLILGLLIMKKSILRSPYENWICTNLHY